MHKDNEAARVYSLRQPTSKVTYNNLTWWVLLVMAVLVVPSTAFIFTSVLDASGGSEIAIFIAACWLCVYIGLRLMKAPRIKSIVFERVTLSGPVRERCINMIGMIETDMPRWKSRYEKYDTLFMNLSKQPAWDYLDELTAILSNIKQSVSQDGTISYPEITALTGWVDSAKTTIIQGYLQALKTIYGYARFDLMEKGKKIEDIFPDLAQDNAIDIFLKTPTSIIQYAHELWDIIEKEHPILAAPGKTRRAAMAA
jgi:hypothetical protein